MASRWSVVTSAQLLTPAFLTRMSRTWVVRSQTPAVLLSAEWLEKAGAGLPAGSRMGLVPVPG